MPPALDTTAGEGSIAEVCWRRHWDSSCAPTNATRGGAPVSSISAARGSMGIIEDASMATIRKEISTRARATEVWDAIRDIGALHTRLVPGFVTQTQLEPGARVVTFANGWVVKEPIVTIDDAAMRLVWTAEGGLTTHFNASVQVMAGSDGGSRVVWIADLLPSSAAATIDAAMTAGAAAMKKTLDGIRSSEPEVATPPQT
jgi:hypothetical protein